MKEDPVPMGSDGLRRPATLTGMWSLEVNRPLQDVNTNKPAPRLVVRNPFRRARGRIIGEVVEPSPEPNKPNKRTHSAAVEDEDENEVRVVESEPEPSPSKRTHSAAFSAAEDEDEVEDDVPMAGRRQRLRHDEVMLLEEIVRERPARDVERPSRTKRKPNVKYVKRGMEGEKGQGLGRGRGWRKGKGRK